MTGTLVVTIMFIFFAVGIAEAVGAGGGAGLPWETGISTLQQSLTGPFAFAVAMLLIVVGFVGVAFMGADFGGWVKWVIGAAVLIGMLGGAETVLGLFGMSAAMVAGG